MLEAMIKMESERKELPQACLNVKGLPDALAAFRHLEARGDEG